MFLFKIVLINSLLTFLLIEISSAIVIEFNLIGNLSRPSIYQGKILQYGNRWRTEKDDWGSWHKTNYVDRHVSECFDVKYTSGRFGNRIKSLQDDININNSQSIVLLGDSNAEGYGLSFEQTFGHLLSIKLERQVINLGSAGHFGILQSELLYGHFKNIIQHNNVILFFTPENDFNDNNYVYMNKYINNNPDRYRPYYDDNDRIFYPENSIKKNEWLGGENYISHILRIYKSFFYNAQLIKFMKYRTTIQSSYGDDNYQEKVIKSIASIESMAKELNAEMTVIILHSFNENSSYKNSNWYKKIVSDFKTIEFDNSIKENYLSCDGHYNHEGAKMILKAFTTK
jgi:hypothetical protein